MQGTQEMQFWSLGREDPLEQELASHSSILAWEIPWTERPGELQSMGSQRVWHDWAPPKKELFPAIPSDFFYGQILLLILKMWDVPQSMIGKATFLGLFSPASSKTRIWSDLNQGLWSQRMIPCSVVWSPCVWCIKIFSPNLDSDISLEAENLVRLKYN